MTEPLRVQFVCLGNICRSPVAEGVFRALVARAGLSNRFEVASAGTGRWHIGEPPHTMTQTVARGRGVDLSAQRARHFGVADLDRFDEVLAMDAQNLAHIRALLQPNHRARVGLLLDELGASAPLHEVPDPYGGDRDGFERVHSLVEQACGALLERLMRGR